MPGGQETQHSRLGLAGSSLWRGGQRASVAGGPRCCILPQSPGSTGAEDRVIRGPEKGREAARKQ